MKKKEKTILAENYLDLIPEKHPALRSHTDRKGHVVLEVENNGVMNKIAQGLFNKPKVTNVHLDEMGTFVWPLIDGKRSIGDIALLVKEHFGEKAEPLYQRIVKYFQIVESYHFISLRSQEGSTGDGK